MKTMGSKKRYVMLPALRLRHEHMCRAIFSCYIARQGIAASGLSCCKEAERQAKHPVHRNFRSSGRDIISSYACFWKGKAAKEVVDRRQPQHPAMNSYRHLLGHVLAAAWWSLHPGFLQDTINDIFVHLT